MAQVGIKELLEAGVHFGHQTRRWNPKMRRFIFGERGGIYLIDLLQTEELLAQGAGVRLRRSPTAAARVLFVGTKKQARDAIKDAAEASGMPYVNHRWLGGLLTNFQTISLRIKRLHDLERYETEGQLDLLPTRERISAQADLAKLQANLGGVKNMQRVPRRDVRRRPQDRGDRRARGAAPAHPDHRPRRHQLRPGRDRLRDPRQRRRDPLLRADRQRDRRRRGRGPRASSAPRRSARARRPRSARAARPRSARSARPRSRPARGRGGRRAGRPTAGRARGRAGRRRRGAGRRRRRRSAGQPPQPSRAEQAPRPRRPRRATPAEAEPADAGAAPQPPAAEPRAPPSPPPSDRAPPSSGSEGAHRMSITRRRTSRPCATAPARG